MDFARLVSICFIGLFFTFGTVVLLKGGWKLNDEPNALAGALVTGLLAVTLYVLVAYPE